jgi:hypothetical protein
MAAMSDVPPEPAKAISRGWIVAAIVGGVSVVLLTVAACAGLTMLSLELAPPKPRPPMQPANPVPDWLPYSQSGTPPAAIG